MFDRTVVGWDGSDEARAAAEWALERSGDRPVVLAQVAGHKVSDAEFFAADSPAARARIRLDEAGEGLRRDHPSGHIDTRLLIGDREDALVGETSPRTLLVIGHRAGRKALRWSFTARLAGTVRGALVVVPAGARARAGIVVGVDGTPQSESALEAAAAEGERSGQEVVVIHAWQMPPTVDDDNPYEDAYIEGAEQMREAMLEELIAAAAERHPGVVFRGGVLPGSPAHILREAAEGASMLIVGNRHRSLGARLFLGSVAAALIAAPGCPTMVVNADLADLVASQAGAEPVLDRSPA
jgi:nucleotide-binding universal stress UspA family protein